MRRHKDQSSHLGLFHSGEKRWQDLMEPGLILPSKIKPITNLKLLTGPPSRNLVLTCTFCHFAQHSFLSKKLSPRLDQLSWLDVEKRGRTSTENAVQNHEKIDVFVATTWWWKFPPWFKRSETRYMQFPEHDQWFRIGPGEQLLKQVRFQLHEVKLVS